MNTTSLTFTRFIAAIYVVILHFGRNTFPFDGDSVKYFFSNGAISVSYFFFISGFVMAIAYYKKGLRNTFNKWNYWVNRISRLYPIYIFSLALLCFIIVYFWNMKINVVEFILHIFLLQAWFKGFELTLNYPGWSLSVELLFYFLFPFILDFILKNKFKTVVILSFIIWLISQVITVFYSIPFFPLIHLNTFLSGIVLGVFLINNNQTMTILRKYSTIILLLSIVFFVFIFSFPNPIGRHSHNGLLVPLFILMVIGLVYSKNIITSLFSTKIFILLGEISYGVYILQYPSQMVTRYINDKSGNFFYKTIENEFYIHLAVLLFLSFITYFLIEIPFKNFLRKIYKKNI